MDADHYAVQRLFVLLAKVVLQPHVLYVELGEQLVDLLGFVLAQGVHYSGDEVVWGLDHLFQGDQLFHLLGGDLYAHLRHVHVGGWLNGSSLLLDRFADAAFNDCLGGSGGTLILGLVAAAGSGCRRALLGQGWRLCLNGRSCILWLLYILGFVGFGMVFKFNSRFENREFLVDMLLEPSTSVGASLVLHNLLQQMCGSLHDIGVAAGFSVFDEVVSGSYPHSIHPRHCLQTVVYRFYHLLTHILGTNYKLLVADLAGVGRLLELLQCLLEHD